MVVHPVQHAPRMPLSLPSSNEPPSPAVPAPPPASKAPLLNPDPVIDATLGIVVLQTFNRDGVVTSTTPSARQLESYRAAAGRT